MGAEGDLELTPTRTKGRRVGQDRTCWSRAGVPSHLLKKPKNRGQREGGGTQKGQREKKKSYTAFSWEQSEGRILLVEGSQQWGAGLSPELTSKELG